MAKVNLGKRKTNQQQQIVWNSDEAINPHWVVFGAPGVGKTYRIRDIVTQIAQTGAKRLYVFDVHSDLTPPDSITSTVTFSEHSTFGINPLAVDPDPYSGGVRRRTTAFLSMMDRYSSGGLGERQKNCLTHLMQDYYIQNGFHPDRPATWRPEKSSQTTIHGLLSFIRAKLECILLGGNSETQKAFESLAKKLRKLQSEKKKSLSEQDLEELAKIKEQCCAAFANAIDKAKTGKEIDDLLRYDTIDVLRSVHKRIENINALGIFKEKPPTFDRNKPVWRFDLFHLTAEAQGYLIEISLEKVFRQCKQRGLSKPDTYIFLDEAHLFLSTEPDHIINKIVREARKFGLGIILSSQNYSDFSEETATCCATRMILGLDERYYDRLGRIFSIKPGRFHFIEPWRTALVQIKTSSTDLENKFLDVLLPSNGTKAPTTSPQDSRKDKIAQ